MNRLAIIWHDLAFEQDTEHGQWSPTPAVAGALGRLHRSGFELVLASAVGALREAAGHNGYSEAVDALHAAERALRHDVIAGGGQLHATLFSPQAGPRAIEDVLATVSARRRFATRPVLLTGQLSIASNVPTQAAQVILVGPVAPAADHCFESLDDAVTHLQAEAAQSPATPAAKS